MKKIRIDPLYVFLAVVACLPFAAIWLSRAGDQAEAFRRVRFDWVAVDLPGQVVETKVVAPGRMHYITAGDAERMAVVALIPAPEGSPPRRAVAAGAPEVALLFDELFPSQELRDLDARLVADEAAYRLTGRRGVDGWPVRGRMRLLAERPFVLVILVSAAGARDAAAVMDRVAGSIAVQPPAPNDADPDAPAEGGGPAAAAD